jgi:hypothetical protein
MVEMRVTPSKHVLDQRVEVGKGEGDRKADGAIDSEPGELETELNVIGCLTGGHVGARVGLGHVVAEKVVQAVAEHGGQ